THPPKGRTFCRPVLSCAGGASLPDLTPHLSTAVCSPLSGPPRGPRPGARILKPWFVYLRSAVSIEEYPLLLLRFPIGYAATCRSLERLTAPKYLPCGGDLLVHDMPSIQVFGEKSETSKPVDGDDEDGNDDGDGEEDGDVGEGDDEPSEEDGEGYENPNNNSGKKAPGGGAGGEENGEDDDEDAEDPEDGDDDDDDEEDEDEDDGGEDEEEGVEDDEENEDEEEDDEEEELQPPKKRKK
ncbi:hypothetical protein B296_00010762, partial [Ensete ventricosum]